MISPIDQSAIGELTKVDRELTASAVAHAGGQHEIWSGVDLPERRRRVMTAVAHLTEARTDLALLLAWEIGKPWRLACADVDRCLDGVRWYAENVEEMLSIDVEGQPFRRRPLPGPVSNIASWNYPMSVLVHSELVQLLAGNAVIAKTPTQGGSVTLAVAHSLMHEAGLPVTLLAGDGAELSQPLVESRDVGGVVFVGGRGNGAKIASQLTDNNKRHILEQEGLNAWGIWEFSQWEMLGDQLRRGFEYAKQRCTAYPRYVVQRRLVDQFLDAYLEAAKKVRFGHPLAAESAADAFLDLEYGPLISASKSRELEMRVEEALHQGAVPIYRAQLGAGRFLPGQNVDAYFAPAALLAPPGASRLMHEEPFGPVDTIVVVDTEAELLAQMNASNGALVASLACDDSTTAERLARQLHAFKVGINRPRSRGDRDEPFGGAGASWRGAFVGGTHLVHAVTTGPAGERLFGNFPAYLRIPS
jgi:acyl-CoA reductase-like NAD-dependent aldehyde dehydrogenase